MEKKFLPARAAGIAGIIFVVAAAVPGFASGSPPDPSDPAAKFLSYYHDNRSALITAALLGMIGTFFAFFFFAKLISALRRADGETGALTLVAVVSIAVVATMAAIGGILSATAAFRLGGAEHIDAVTLVAFNDAASITFALLGVPLAAFFASQGLLMMGTRLLPAWLAVLNTGHGRARVRRELHGAVDDGVLLAGRTGRAVPRPVAPCHCRALDKHRHARPAGAIRRRRLRSGDGGRGSRSGWLRVAHRLHGAACRQGRFAYP